MDPAVAGPPGSAPTLTFEDGLGERHFGTGPGHNPLEYLRLRKALSAVPSFEFGLRERAGRLADFRSEWFGNVRDVELDKLTSELILVSDYVPGVRLATLLAAAEKLSLSLEIDAAACLIRQLVSAVRAWQEILPGVCHGAIGPERIVVTPQGRLVVVEYVLGSALEQLRYPRAQYWTQLRVPLPATSGPRSFDPRVDVTQIGAVALALIRGRLLREDEYPDRIIDLVGGAAIRRPIGDPEPVSDGLRQWLLRSLQLDTDASFPSAERAQREIDEALPSRDQTAELRALRAFLARCRMREAREVPVVPAVPAEGPAVAAEVATVAPEEETPEVDLSPRIEALKAFLARYPPRDAANEAAAATVQSAPATLFPSEEEAQAQPTEEPSGDVEGRQLLLHERPRRRIIPLPLGLRTRRRLLIGGAIALAVAVIGFAGFTWLPWGGARTGSLLVGTNPAGASVLIDGTTRGVTPLSVELPPGNHTVDLLIGNERRRVPVTITAGGQVSHFIELPRGAQELGELLVRANIPGASVSVDGQVLGRSPLTVPALSPGEHTVVLQHESVSTTERVFIEAGRTTTLVVSMPNAPAAATAAGWVSISAPTDVQVYEDDRLLGNSSIDRIMLPVGRHELVIVNESLKYRVVHTVQVNAGQVSRIALRWPQGSLAINAVPWAEVWLDGKLIGETPIGNVTVPIGAHEIVFRHPQLGERRSVVTVTAGKPTKIGVDLGAK
jgi:hypothetical protein